MTKLLTAILQTAACVVEYLGLYTHRVAISNNSLLNLADGKVAFKWRDYKNANKQKAMTISAEEFIRRVLLHILPHGFMKICHYAFLASWSKAKKLKLCKALTNTKLNFKDKSTTEQLIEKLIGRKPFVCQSCGCQKLMRAGLSPPQTLI